MSFKNYFERAVRTTFIFGFGFVFGAGSAIYGLRNYGKEYVWIKANSVLNEFAQGALEKGIDIAGKSAEHVLGDVIEEQSRNIGKLALKFGLDEYERLNRDIKRSRERREQERFDEIMKNAKIVRRG